MTAPHYTLREVPRVVNDTVILSEASQLYREAKSKAPCISPAATMLVKVILLGALLTLTTPPAHAQGCAQCLDNTRATPPAVQSAYRKAIFLLGGAGATLFLAGAFLLRRNP